jgi:hypothetical protein
MATLALGLTACGGLTRFHPVDPKPVVQLKEGKAQPPQELTKVCDDPVRLPKDRAGAGLVERLWGKDRTALRECGQRNRELVQFYKDRDARLAGDKR